MSGVNEAGVNEAGVNEAGANEAGANEAGAGEAGAGEAGAGEAGLDEADVTEAGDPDVIVLEEADVVVIDEEPRHSGVFAAATGSDPRLADEDADPDAAPQAADSRMSQAAEPGLAGAQAGAQAGADADTDADAWSPAGDPVSTVRDADQGGYVGSAVDDGQDAGYPRADIAADTGPELTNVGTAGPTTGAGPDEPAAPVVAEPAARTAQLQERWLAIQSDFVDDPRRSVTAAAALVTEAIETHIAELKERDASLHGTWNSGNADTEVLRNALRDYRSFLDRLVAL